MNPKTLVIGCSDLTGVYTDDDKVLADEKSWALRVADRYSGTFKCISLPGHGVHLYTNILKRLDELDKLSQFDNIIVQMTSELRLRQYPDNFDPFPEIFMRIDNDKTETMHFFQTMEKPVYSNNSIELYDRYEKHFSGTQAKIDFTKVLTDMYYQDNMLVKILYSYIETLCDKNNIKSYYVSTRGVCNGLLATEIVPREKYMFDDGHMWVYKYFANKICGTDDQFDLKKTGHMSNALHPTMKIIDDIADLMYERLEANGFQG